MAVQSAITLNTKVYAPRGTTAGLSTWALVGDATFGGATSSATFSLRGPNTNGIHRVTLGLKVPKAATTDTACGCAGTTISESIGRIEITVPQNFTAAERLDLCERWQALVAHAIFQSGVESLEPVW